MNEPDYQQAFYDIIRALEIMANSLSGEPASGDAAQHSHVLMASNPRDRALDHLRGAADFAGLEGFMFDYIPFGVGHELRLVKGDEQ